MSHSFPNQNENRLLTALPVEEYKRLLPKMEAVSLTLKQPLYEPNEPIQYLYFVKNGVVSLVNLMEDGSVVEVATVGNEGMVGLPVFLGAVQIPGKAFVQIPGDGWRLRADVFTNEVTL